MDRCLLLSTMILVCIFSHSYVTGTTCAQLGMCSCSENRYSEVVVDCHGVKEIETIMCTICNKINNITSLDMSSSEITSIPFGCFAGCSELKQLIFMSNMIETLANGSLKGLKNLETLNLNNNKMLQSSKLSSFDELNTLYKLNALSLRNNSGPGILPSYNICHICGFLPNVTVLDISENKMNRVPSSCFAQCSNLEKLSLESNDIANTDKSSFAALGALKVLNLDNNRVIVDGNLSHPDLFKPLRSLEELHIQNNTKNRNDSKVFTYLANIGKDSLKNVQRLFLDGLPNGVLSRQFKTFKQLTNLNFSGETSNCYMFSLTNITFQNIYAPSLESLHLSHCNISTIDAGTFENLTALNYLNLSYNMALGFPTLRNVSYGLQFTKIKILDYSAVYIEFGLTTQITRCDVQFLQNTTLKEIHVNNNRLAKVEINAIMWMPESLEIVYAEENSIEFGNYAFQLGCICNLKRIEMSGQGRPTFVNDFYNECKIKENIKDTSGGCNINKSVCDKCIPPLEECPNNFNVSSLTVPDKLETVSLRNSNLHSESTEVKAPIPMRNNLKSLDLSNNVFHSWTENMVLVDKLRMLNLSSNFGTNISSAFFTNCPKLENLDASNNIIGNKLAEDTNGKLFQNLTFLQYLNFSKNWIEVLPFQLFKYTTLLRHLDLSFNRLKDISFEYKQLEHLSQLYLQSNRLSTVPVSLLKQIETNFNKHATLGIDIDLSNNILDGSCKNIKFLLWLNKHKNYFSNIYSYQFLRDDGTISFTEMSNSIEMFEKHCRNYTPVLFISACFVLIFICITIGGILHRYRWRLRYLYYLAKARYGGYVPVRGNEDNDNYRYDIFISYANDDYRFVTGEMHNKLESVGLSMCLHQKDFLPGSYIAENILRAIKSSRKTVIVLSPSFLDSKWCMYEFNMARMEGIYGREGESIVYTVMYEEIDISRISDEMRECLESESYLAYPQEEEERPYFWEMLTRALSDTRNG